jgi:hypothetical protein
MRKLYVFAATAIAVLALAAVAYAENTYTVDGSKKPAGKGSKAKPLPISLNFSFGVGNTDSTLRGSPIQIYAIGSEGLVTYPKSFPTCTFAQTNSATVSSKCKKAKTGGGLVQALVGPPSDLTLAGSLTCNIKLTLYNISGAGSKGGMSIRLDVEPPAPPAGSRTLGCLTPVHQAIKAKFVTTKIGGLPASELRFTVPDELLHPAGLDNVVQNNESLIKKWVAKKRVKGDKVGYYSAIGCKGGKRTIRSTFTSEDGVKKTATKDVKC